MAEEENGAEGRPSGTGPGPSAAPARPADPSDILVFEAVVSAFFQKLVADKRDLAPYFKRLYELSWKFPWLRSLDVQHATGVARLKEGARRDAMGEALADAIEAMADITLIETGRPIVLREAADCVEQALQAFGQSDVTVLYRRKIMSSGLVPREAVEREEPIEADADPNRRPEPPRAAEGRQVLFLDENQGERDGYVRRLVGAALRRNDSVLVMLVKQSRRAFLASLGLKEIEVSAVVKAGHVMLVQCKTVPELVEEEDIFDEPDWVVTVPPDATGLARALRLWLDKVAKGGRRLAILDVGAMFGWDTSDRTMKAVGAMRTRLRRDGVNALYLMDKWSVDSKANLGFAAGFDEVIEKKHPAVKA